MDLLEAAKKCFDEGRVMQLGTSHKGQPRVSSVYYVSSDDYHSVYWMSEPKRRHSIDLVEDPRTAGAIATKTDWPVIGIQFTGIADEVRDLDEIRDVADKYNRKYDYVADGFAARYQEGKNKHLIYKLTITNLELFDQVNFTGDPVVIQLD